MRTIIAGSRGFTDYSSLLVAVQKSGFDISTVISGTAQGADRLGEQWAKMHRVPLERYPADWRKHGKSAGYKRNMEMAENADALIALWDGESRGTKHMIDIARKAKLKVFIFIRRLGS